MTLKYCFLIFLFLSCTQNIRSIKELNEKINYHGCWASFDKEKILNHYCSDHLNLNSQFLIASLSKMFVGATLIKLEEENIIATRDNIIKYFPELEKNPDHLIWKELRLYHLVKHKAGTPDFYQSEIWKKYAFQKPIFHHDLIDFFIKTPINHQTVGIYDYSNSGYILLGEIIRRKLQKSMQELYDSFFFERLQMRNTVIGSNAKFLVKNESTEKFKELHINELFSDGNLVSSAYDMTKWSQAILKNEGLFKDKYSYLKYLKPAEHSYAYGIFVFKDNGIDYANHAGAWLGHRSYLILDLTNQKGMIFLSHKMTNEDFDKFKDYASQIFFTNKSINPI